MYNKCHLCKYWERLGCDKDYDVTISIGTCTNSAISNSLVKVGCYASLMTYGNNAYCTQFEPKGE